MFFLINSCVRLILPFRKHWSICHFQKINDLITVIPETKRWMGTPHAFLSKHCPSNSQNSNQYIFNSLTGQCYASGEHSATDLVQKLKQQKSNWKNLWIKITNLLVSELFLLHVQMLQIELEELCCYFKKKYANFSSLSCLCLCEKNSMSMRRILRVGLVHWLFCGLQYSSQSFTNTNRIVGMMDNYNKNVDTWNKSILVFRIWR